MKKVGIYIGAFDPIHEGHLQFASSAIMQNDLHRLYFLVDPTPRYSQGVKAHVHRVNMAILGVADQPMIGTIVQKYKSTTADCIKLLQKRFNGHKLMLIMPEESLGRFIKTTSFLSQKVNELDIKIGLTKKSPDDIKQKFNLLSQITGLKFKYSTFNSNSVGFKTDEIKRQLKCGKQPTALPTAVYEYIVKQRLYTPVSSA